MKKLAILLPLVVAGCVSASGVSNTIREVQTHTANICNYVPYADVIRRVLDRAGALDTAFGLANEFCAAVTTLPLAEGPGKRQAVVRGVVVRGRFVR